MNSGKIVRGTENTYYKTMFYTMINNSKSNNVGKVESSENIFIRFGDKICKNIDSE